MKRFRLVPLLTVFEGNIKNMKDSDQKQNRISDLINALKPFLQNFTKRE